MEENVHRLKQKKNVLISDKKLKKNHLVLPNHKNTNLLLSFKACGNTTKSFLGLLIMGWHHGSLLICCLNTSSSLCSLFSISLNSSSSTPAHINISHPKLKKACYFTLQRPQCMHHSLMHTHMHRHQIQTHIYIKITKKKQIETLIGRYCI